MFILIFRYKDYEVSGPRKTSIVLWARFPQWILSIIVCIKALIYILKCKWNSWNNWTSYRCVSSMIIPHRLYYPNFEKCFELIFQPRSSFEVCSATSSFVCSKALKLSWLYLLSALLSFHDHSLVNHLSQLLFVISSCQYLCLPPRCHMQ